MLIKLFQLRGAPYKVNVIGASYPNRVVVNGEGLRGGLYGQNLDFRIDTRKAGAGEWVKLLHPLILNYDF